MMQVTCVRLDCTQTVCISQSIALQIHADNLCAGMMPQTPTPQYQAAQLFSICPSVLLLFLSP